MMGDSLNWHKRTLNHLLATVGDSHIYTAHPCLTVAEHLLRQGEDRDARSLLDQAIRIYKMHPGYKEDLARTYYVYGRLLARNPANATKAMEMLDRAAESLNTRYSHTEYRGSELKNENFYGLGTIGFI